MKLFLKRGLLFAIPFFLVVFFARPLDRWISHFLTSQSSIYYVMDEYAVWDDIFEGNIDADLIIEGSSRAWLHFNPSIISDSLGMQSYNLGVDGHNFWLQYFRHTQYLKHNRKPSTILYSVDFGTLEKVNKDMYNYNYQQFLPYMIDNKEIQDYTSNYIVFSKWSSKLPLIRYAGEFNLLKDAAIMEMRKGKVFKKRTRGFVGIEQKWNSDLERAKRKSAGITVEVDSTLVKKFKNYLKYCKKNEIEVVLIYAPIHNYGVDFVKNHEEIVELYKDLANESDLHFLDYSSHEMGRDTSYFYNSTHLNSSGADSFSQLLVKDMKMLGLGERFK